MKQTYLESAKAIASIDALLLQGELKPGKRATRKGLAGPRRQQNELREWQPGGEWLQSSNGVEVLVEPQWLKLKWLRHGFSSRSGGASKIYAGDVNTGDLNLSWTKEDDAKFVRLNRKRFVAAVAVSGFKLVTLRQTHSGVVRNLDKIRKPMEKAGRAVLRGDAMMTTRSGLLLGIQTADCVPVLLVDVKKKVVAAFHAGWRGTLARIVERGAGTMRLTYGSRTADLRAVIGPGIGPCCYAVSDDVHIEFDSQFAYAPELFSEVYDSDPIREKYPMLFLTQRAPGHSNIGPQIHLDLWEANRRQLLAAGLEEKNISVLAQCTSCQRQKFFSHRRDSGLTGRMLNAIGIAAVRSR
jgi:polyphenol oxidase